MELGALESKNKTNAKQRDIKTCLTPLTIRPRPKSIAKDPMRLTAAPSTEPMLVKSKPIWREDIGNTIIFGKILVS